MTREEVLELAGPILERLRALDPDQPAACEGALAALDTSAFEAAVRAAHAEGWATPKEAGGVRFGRLAKAGQGTAGFSIDVVEMSGAASGAHTHLKGEFDLSFPLDGTPAFDGRGGRWVVYPPGSRHVPTVTGGRMLIVYFLPEGAIRFEN
jgi:2-hydroxylaminobenzoate mutase